MNCRHSNKKEPPLPVLIGLAMHSHASEKRIIKKLYSNGLCISYDHVIEIESNITKDLCQKYKVAELFVHHLYTLVYLHVRQSTTLTTTLLRQHQRVHFRKPVSLFQYSTKEMQNKRFIYTEGTENLKPSLPESYTNILPAKNTKPEPSGAILCSNTNNLNGIDLWIKQLSSFDFINNQENEISFAVIFS